MKEKKKSMLRLVPSSSNNIIVRRGSKTNNNFALSSVVATFETMTTIIILSSARRTYFGHDVSQGVKGESDRGGPQRVPSMRKDGTLFDPALRSPDAIRHEFDRENEQLELESAKLRAAYTGTYNAQAALAGLDQRINNTHNNSAGTLGRRQEEIDLENSIRNATPSKGEWTSNDPDDLLNPHRSSQTGRFGDFDERTTASQESFLSGSLQDRESIRVRGQKPPPDLPLTDDEVWQHPAAKNMRIAGIFMLFFVLDIMWNLTTDPFNEGERYSRFALRMSDIIRDDQVDYLKDKEDQTAIRKQVESGKALRDSILPWRQ